MTRDKVIVDIEWCEDDDGSLRCLAGVVVVGEIRHAAEGEVEGGLGALARFMLGALQPDVEQPSPPPAGVYWTATRTRGVWEPWRRADDITAAKSAVEDALTTYFAERHARSTV